jgi:hypothetical protein
MRKEHKNPKGGLTEKGRKHFEKKDGGDLKKPISKGDNPRRVSFAARFAGMDAKMKDKLLRTSTRSLKWLRVYTTLLTVNHIAAKRTKCLMAKFTQALSIQSRPNVCITKKTWLLQSAKR